MPAYVIARVEVTDWEKYNEYLKVGPGTLPQYGGRFIARNGEKATLEGPKENRRLIILEFPSLAKAKEWYNSKEYQNAKKLRTGASIGSLVAIDGVKDNS
ncbi:MAG: DUF1330 domain-containing protein [Sedimentisphaerales bacterium]|nr:DUF1330 domain-containing protein [Sedimentisphaerales bacterium]